MYVYIELEDTDVCARETSVDTQFCGEAISMKACSLEANQSCKWCNVPFRIFRDYQRASFKQARKIENRGLFTA